MTKPEPLRLAAWRAFITAHARVVDRIEDDLAAAGQIPLTWYDVLVELSESPGCRLRLGELARAVVLSRSGVTRLVDRLEAVELLRREPDPDDRRGAYAVLTEQGRRALRRAWPVYAGGIEAHFGRHLSDAQAEAVGEALRAVLAGVEATAPGCSPATTRAIADAPSRRIAGHRRGCRGQ